MKKKSENIFVLFERYLAKPTAELVMQIEQLANSLVQQAIIIAQNHFPGKIIGGDQYQIVLKDYIIKQQAKEAFDLSARLIKNPNFIKEKNDSDDINFILSKENATSEYKPDPAYIFRLTEQESNQIKVLFDQSVSKSKKHSTAILFAYGCYLERRKSSFSYCNELEAIVYKHNALLYQKAQNLIDSGHYEAAKQLNAACSIIKGLCAKSFPIALQNPDLKKIKDVLEQTINTKAMKEHYDSKESVVNFLLAISGFGLVYLACTQNTRGAFWYHVETDREHALEAYNKEISPFIR